jgi:AraC-like DNA-binding protein
MLRDADGCLARPVQWGAGGLQLLMGYLEVLRHKSTTPTRELQRLAVAHVYDLLALTLGATSDVAEIAKGRGVAAARLRAIQEDIHEHLSDGELHISSLARRHRLTPRYVQMLFEAEGITFTEFVRAQRLARAHRMLATPHFDHLRVSDVAFECGFGDVSYFNRAFRAHYGATPSDVRNNRNTS